MKIGYSFVINTALYNRTYAKNIIDAKRLEITVTAEAEESFNASVLKQHVDVIKNNANGAYFVRVDDPIMTDLLEPKAGNTVHNRLNELKRELMNTYQTQVIGTTVPPETRNGIRVFVMGSNYTVTLEGIALYLLNYFDLTNVKNQIVTIFDGTITVTLDNEDRARTQTTIEE